MVRMLSLCSAAAIAAAFAMPTPVLALSMKECGAKYQAAKEADTLKGKSWNDYRKAECAAADDDAAAPASPAPAPKPAPKPTATAAPSSGGGGLTMKECSVKYQAAKEANTLKGMKWNDFRKAECSDDDASEADAAAAEKAETPAAKPTAGQKTPPTSTTAEAPKKPTMSGKIAFPSDVAPKYADETAGKARMHTCLDQYRANKANNVDQPNWIEKGGGYYSQCNTRLKAGA